MPAKIRATVWFVLDRRLTSHHGQQTAAEGGGGNAEIARPQQDGHRRAEACAGGGPQNVRRHHGVAEHGLIRRTRSRERRADERSRQNARQADLDDNRGLLRRPCGCEAQTPARNAGQRPVSQQPRGLYCRDAVPAQQERQKKDRRQQNQKDQDTPPARFFRSHLHTPNKSVVFHTVPPFASSCQAKGAGFYSELPNLTENPPLRGPDELNRQYAYFIAAYALRFRPQSARLHCFRYSSLVIIMWRKPSSTPNSRKPALRWVSHAAISFRVTAKSLWILEMPQSRNA